MHYMRVLIWEKPLDRPLSLHARRYLGTQYLTASNPNDQARTAKTLDREELALVAPSAFKIVFVPSMSSIFPVLLHSIYFVSILQI